MKTKVKKQVLGQIVSYYYVLLRNFMINSQSFQIVCHLRPNLFYFEIYGINYKNMISTERVEASFFLGGGGTRFAQCLSRKSVSQPQIPAF